MKLILAIAGGGALGALCRYWLSVGVHRLAGSGFPYGTLTVNVIGSLLVGFLSVWLVERLAAPPELRAMLIIGMIGAFTTFSTFSLETLNLLEQGLVWKAALNVGFNLGMCLAATLLGLILGRQL